MTTKLASFLIAASCLVTISKASAESANVPTKGITVSPSIAQLDLKTEKPVSEITYRNSTDSVIELQLSAQDFRDMQDGYRLQFLDKKDSANYKYSLASWITFENLTLVLSPGESKNAKVFIDASRLSIGGHYASIQAEISQGTGPDQIKVKGILSSLLFVRTATGNEIEELNIEALVKGGSTRSIPDSFSITVKNSGNVELSPHGLLTVQNQFGKEVARGYLNEGSNIALPETIRTFSIPVTVNSKIFLPGTYKAKVAVSYGKSGKVTEKTITFFSFGSSSFIGAILTICILLVLIGLIIFKRELVIAAYKRIKKQTVLSNE